MSTNVATNVDPNVRLPGAVAAQIARANEIIDQMKAPQPQDGQPVQEQPVDKTAEQVAQEQPVDKTAEQVAQEQPVDKQAQPAGEKQLTAQDWERRYKSLYGQMRVMRQENEALATKLREAEQYIQTLASAKTEQPQAQLTAEERDEYGADFINVVSKVVKEAVTPDLQKRDEHINKLTQKLEQTERVITEGARDRLYSHLDTTTPQWRELNTHPDFLEWLNDADVFSGQPRQKMLMEAFKGNDAARVAAFFTGFLRETAAVAPSAKPAGEQTPKASLKDFAAPGKAKPSATPSSDAKPIITRQYIHDFYKGATDGKFRGRDEEKRRIEAMIFDAQRDGRVR